MVDIQTNKLNGHTSNASNSSTSPVRGFVGQAAEVTGDVIELVELQLELLSADTNAALKTAFKPLCVIMTGGVILLASFPIVLFATAGLLSTLSGLNIEFAQLMVGLVAGTTAIIAMSMAGRALKSSLTPFDRSSKEFKHNLVWLKSIFRSTH